MNIFAVVCAGNVLGLNEMLQEFNPPVACLYNEPIQEEILKYAPFLIEIQNHDGVKRWLSQQDMPWGMYFLTKKTVSFNELRQHLRRYTYVKIPSQDKPVLFKFYDPRVFWDFAKVIDDWNLHAMLGPIDIVASNYNELKQDHFEERRKKYPQNIKMKGLYLSLTKEQEQLLGGYWEENYLREKIIPGLWKYIDPAVFEEIAEYERSVILFEEAQYYETEIRKQEFLYDSDKEFLEEQEKRREMLKNYIVEPYRFRSEDELKKTFEKVIRDFYYYCLDCDITEFRSIYVLLTFIISRGFFSFEEIPKKWIDYLSDRSETGIYRGRMAVHKIEEGEM